MQTFDQMKVLFLGDSEDSVGKQASSRQTLIYALTAGGALVSISVLFAHTAKGFSTAASVPFALAWIICSSSFSVVLDSGASLHVFPQQQA